jgi:hypothetical protein
VILNNVTLLIVKEIYFTSTKNDELDTSPPLVEHKQHKKKHKKAKKSSKQPGGAVEAGLWIRMDPL